MLHRLPIFFFLLLLSISNSFAQGRCLVSNGAFNVTNSTFGINIQRGAAKPWECLSSQSNSAVALCNIKSKSASYSVILAGGRDAPSPYRNPYYSGAVGQPLVAPLVPNKKYALHFCGYHYNTIKNSAGNWTSNGAGRVWVVFFDKSDVKFANLRTKNGTGLSGIDLEAITNKKKLTNFNFTKYDTSAWRCKDTCFTVTKKWDYVAFYLEATDHNLNIYLDDVAINEVKPDAGKDKDTCVKRNSTVAVKIGKPTCSTFMTENITYEVDPTGFPTFPNTASSLPITLTFNSVLSNPTVYRESHTVIIRRSLGNCEDFDTVVITFKPRPEAILLKDTVICAPPNSYKLTVITNPPTPPNFKYLWSTGDTTDTFTIRKSGRYYVRVTDTNACYTDTSQKITFRPEIILPEDTTLCTKALQKGLKLKVKSGYVEYKWRKDTKTSTVLRTTDTFTVFTPGRYWIYV
ncbi:MAG: hypothetical protein NTX03_05025, partial [Bacteroidetes bacterium]|nr:hypothetical protein [Bacteroidota bacterium]